MGDAEDHDRAPHHEALLSVREVDVSELAGVVIPDSLNGVAHPHSTGVPDKPAQAEEPAGVHKPAVGAVVRVHASCSRRPGRWVGDVGQGEVHTATNIEGPCRDDMFSTIFYEDQCKLNN